ncbi:hypothetical protein STEG23_016884 [Scotinomys teguina]
MSVTPLGRDQDCILKIREPDLPAPWFLDPGGWSNLYFIFPGICTLSLEKQPACSLPIICFENVYLANAKEEYGLGAHYTS